MIVQPRLTEKEPVKLTGIQDSSGRQGDGLKIGRIYQFQSRQCSATTAGARQPPRSIAEVVIEQDHRPVRQIRHNDRPRLAGGHVTSVPVHDSDRICVDVDVVPLMSVALEADLQRLAGFVGAEDGDAQGLQGRTGGSGNRIGMKVCRPWPMELRPGRGDMIDQMIDARAVPLDDVGREAVQPWQVCLGRLGGVDVQPLDLDFLGEVRVASHESLHTRRGTLVHSRVEHDDRLPVPVPLADSRRDHAPFTFALRRVPKDRRTVDVNCPADSAAARSLQDKSATGIDVIGQKLIRPLSDRFSVDHRQLCNIVAAAEVLGGESQPQERSAVVRNVPKGMSDDSPHSAVAIRGNLRQREKRIP